MSAANGGQGYASFATPGASHDDFNATALQVQSILARCNTSTLVKVVSVTTSGGVNAPGFVDFQPLVKQVDGAGNTVSHAPVYHCPYFRLQGGGNAVILDPVVGDIGMASFTNRDISSVIANKAEAAPGSRRWFDMADGIYFGGMLNGAPTQYVQFSGAGIKLHSPTAVILDAPDVKIECQTLEINATASVNIVTPLFNVTATSNLTGPTTIIGAATVVGVTTLDGPIAQTGAGGGSTTAHLIGPLTVDTDVVIAGKSFDGHEHEFDGSNSGPPV